MPRISLELSYRDGSKYEEDVTPDYALSVDDFGEEKFELKITCYPDGNGGKVEKRRTIEAPHFEHGEGTMSRVGAGEAPDETVVIEKGGTYKRNLTDPRGNIARLALRHHA